jgi:glycosyltransferase involved in cell wall biosynthesis
MTRVHLLTPSVVPGDAISQDVLGMRRWFLRQGYPAHVYAGSWHEDLRSRVRPLRAYRRYLQCREDILIYHHSVGWRAGLRLYEASLNRRVVRYHNVTPPAFFRLYNPNYVRTCLRGERETQSLARSHPELLVADSDFNARGLVAAGANASACRTVPPLHAIGRLDRLALEEQLAKRLHGRQNLLFVGRVSPNKGQLHLIRALAHYHHYLGGQAQLVLVGAMDDGLCRYNQELLDEVRRHRLQGRVHFLGKVTDRQLRTCYAYASVFVCASEHEGFCVPLVEAMYYGIPIVAYGSSAAAETLGEAGLVWPTPSPVLLAESIRLIEERPSVRAALVSGQLARFRSRFSAGAIEKRLTEVFAHLLPVTGESSASSHQLQPP